MLNREASQLVFPNLGFNEPWHHVSHHGNEPEKLALLVKLNTGRSRSSRSSSGACDPRRMVTAPARSLALLWGSGMSDSNTHSPSTCRI
jgi:hypothetical protein